MCFIPFLVFGYTWTLYGPSGIKANDICFNAGSEGYSVICTNTGICVADQTGSTWNTYTNGGSPVWGAIPFDSMNILLVMGDGSSLDGVYKFNFITHQFTLMQFVASPTFVQFCTTNSTFYVGSKNDGLMTSINGSDWNFVPFFSSQQISSLDFRENHFVLTTGFQFQCIYNSSDTGKTWHHTDGNGNFMTYLAFHPNGKLYGLIPNSNSASLRSSLDFGQNWDICFWSNDGINTLGFDAIGNVMVGWRSPNYAQGIAKYDTVTSSLTFYNEGLPNKFVNKIRINPVLSSISIFCCTDNGVYFSNDYWTGTNDNSRVNGFVQIMNFPNPCTTTTNIEFLLPEYKGNALTLSIYNNSGVLLSKESYRYDKMHNNSIKVNVARFSAGNYYYRIKAGKYDVIRKMVVEK